MSYQLKIISSALLFFTLGTFFAPFSAGAVAPGYTAEIVKKSYNSTISLIPGKAITFEIEIKNTGTKTWSNSSRNYISLYADGAGKQFKHNFWHKAEQPAKMIEPTVAPGALGHLKFALQAPELLGLYTAKFKLAAEDLTWIPGGAFNVPINITNDPSSSSQLSQTDSTVIASAENFGALKLIQSHSNVNLGAGEKITFRVGFKNIGKENCPIVDTWWQTETGSILITPLPGVVATKPGSATLPFFGVQPVLVDNEGKEIKEKGEISGNLCIKAPWPSMMRSVYGDPKRFFDTYFSQFPGYYFTGDGARRDKDGYFWITGRVDDVLNVSGHRIGSAEVESALVEHKNVAEAAVVGFPHDIKGQAIYAYVTVNAGIQTNDSLKKELIAIVEKNIGKIARPDVIHWAPGLPKTRSGKIMRRILRKIACSEFDTLGDISTLADPSVVSTLIEDKKKFHS